MAEVPTKERYLGFETGNPELDCTIVYITHGRGVAEANPTFKPILRSLEGNRARFEQTIERAILHELDQELDDKGDPIFPLDNLRGRCRELRAISNKVRTFEKRVDRDQNRQLYRLVLTAWMSITLGERGETWRFTDAELDLDAAQTLVGEHPDFTGELLERIRSMRNQIPQPKAA